MRKGGCWSFGFGVVAALLVLALAVPSMAAQQKVKLIYWSMWEPNPIYMAYLEKAGKEFAQKNPLCEGVEVVKVPFSGYEAKYLAGFMARKGAPDMFIGNAFDWAGTYDFADKMPEDLAKNVDSMVFDFQKNGIG